MCLFLHCKQPLRDFECVLRLAGTGGIGSDWSVQRVVLSGCKAKAVVHRRRKGFWTFFARTCLSGCTCLIKYEQYGVDCNLSNGLLYTLLHSTFLIVINACSKFTTEHDLLSPDSRARICTAPSRPPCQPRSYLRLSCRAARSTALRLSRPQI